MNFSEILKRIKDNATYQTIVFDSNEKLTLEKLNELKLCIDQNLFKGKIKWTGLFDNAIDKIELDTAKNEIEARLSKYAGYWYRKQYSKALDSFNEAFKRYQILYAADHAEIASLYQELGLVYSKLGEYDKSLENLNKSLEMNRRLRENGDDVDIALTLNKVGQVYEDINDHEKACKYSLQALQTFKRVYKEAPHLNIAYTQTNIGNAYISLGQYNKALEYHKQALEVKRKIHGEYHWDIPDSLNLIGAT